MDIYIYMRERDMCVSACVCIVCACVRVRACDYLCTCVCVCVCMHGTQENDSPRKMLLGTVAVVPFQKIICSFLFLWSSNRGHNVFKRAQRQR